MKIYLSSMATYVSDDGDTYLTPSGKKANLLGSYVNDKKDLQLIYDGYFNACNSLMVDSGAVTVRAGFANVGLDDYCDYIADIPKKVKDDLGITFVALDVIGESEKSFVNYMKMREKGVENFLPVFHYNEDLKYLERLIDEGFTYIGLGGTHSKNSRKRITYEDFMAWWDFVFFTTDSLGNKVLRYPEIDFHGFAVTSIRALYPFPWYSVDSTTWAKMSAYGKIMTPWGDIRISNHYNAANCRLHVDRRDPKQQKNIVEWCEKFGFTIDELVGNRAAKNTLNVHYFLWLEENIKWEKPQINKLSFFNMLED